MASQAEDGTFAASEPTSPRARSTNWSVAGGPEITPDRRQSLQRLLAVGAVAHHGRHRPGVERLREQRTEAAERAVGLPDRMCPNIPVMW
ncbi:hypothetical protein H4W33_003328 [Kibdelosporangium phytohabitans]|nr:hypothetical protein [Kibdelosporangium phytohabitans]